MKMPLRTQAENNVLKLARKYARMKVFGTYVDESFGEGSVVICHVCGSDVKMYLGQYETDLLRAAVELLSSMSVDETE